MSYATSSSITRKNLGKATLLFSINNFADAKRDKINGQALDSETFTIGASKFYLQIYPNGETDKDQGFVSVYLRNKSEHNVTVEYTMWIGPIDPIGPDSYNSRVLEPGMGWGHPQFIKTIEVGQNVEVKADLTLLKDEVLDGLPRGVSLMDWQLMKKSEAENQEKLAKKLEQKMQRKIKENMEQQLEQKLEKKLEDKLEQKMEQKMDQKLEQKLEVKLEQKLNNKFNEFTQKLEQKLEQQLEDKLEQKMEQKMEQKLELKLEQKLNNKFGELKHKIHAEFKDLKEATDRAPECPICFEELRPPTQIIQCLKGHKLCEPCSLKPEILGCPGGCKAGFMGRDYGMEAFLLKQFQTRMQ